MLFNWKHMLHSEAHVSFAGIRQAKISLIRLSAFPRYGQPRVNVVLFIVNGYEGIIIELWKLHLFTG